jgi:two-component system response regulator ResD
MNDAPAGDPRRARPATIGGVDATPARRSVLIVDDEPTIAEVIARYLERAGYETRIATDGQSALAAAAAARPDLVVLDIMLPGLDGLRVMGRLRDQDPAPIGVILLTARGRRARRVRTA